MKHLTFRLARTRWALAVQDVDAIGEDLPVRALPRVPPAVRGLAVWRGAVVTVLDAALLLEDAALLLEDAAREDAVTLVRLAPPREHTVLSVPARVDVVDGALDADVRLVDLAQLLAGAVAP